LAASFVAIGLFSSSLTDNQIIAFILAVVMSGFMYIGFDFIFSLAWFGPVDLLIQQLGIEAHYKSISRGVIDTRDLIYFVSVIAFFLSLNKLSLSTRKW
jgi:ABC-2 type transport system permease protein